MEILLIGLAVNILTWIATKLNISGTYVALILAFVGGAIYYIATTYYQVESQNLIVSIGGIYATSQAVFNVFKKTGILDKINGDVQ